jgi:hypothetical protein
VITVEAMERREQLIQSAEVVAQLAVNRRIVAQHVSKLEADHEIRKVLDSIIRLWTRLEGPSYFTQESMDTQNGKRQKDHIVPCRVLVDRMIMNPGDCRDLLQSAVVLVEVSGREHRALGGIYADHPELYAEMLVAPVEELAELGRRRYERFGIEIEPYIF